METRQENIILEKREPLKIQNLANSRVLLLFLNKHVSEAWRHASTYLAIDFGRPCSQPGFSFYGMALEMQWSISAI